MCSLSGDGLILAFGSGALGDTEEDICIATRTSRVEPFGEAKRLPAPVNTTSAERHAALSSDGLMLALTTDRPTVRRGSVLIFQRPSIQADFNTDPLVDSSLQTAWYTVGSFASDGRGLLLTTMDMGREVTKWHARPDSKSPFSPGVKLQPPFDTLGIGMPRLSADGMTLYFHSRLLPNGYGDLDLWMSRRVKKVTAKNTLD